jgi:hypothetical protein
VCSGAFEVQEEKQFFDGTTVIIVGCVLNMQFNIIRKYDGKNLARSPKFFHKQSLWEAGLGPGNDGSKRSMLWY